MAGRVLSVPVGEAVEFPSVPLVEGGVVGEEVEGGNALSLHVGADVIQQLPCQAPSAAVGFDIQGADIGSEVGAVVEVVGDDPRAADDAVTLQNGVPRGDGGLSRKGVGHALLVGGVGDAPLIVEPGGQRGEEGRDGGQGEDMGLGHGWHLPFGGSIAYFRGDVKFFLLLTLRDSEPRRASARHAGGHQVA